jgi:flagellar motor protein MotB
MAARIVDEREHRRGVVLGLTLAEALLLLLFLLMLALTIPLKGWIELGRKAQRDLEAMKPVAELFRAGDNEKISDLAERLRALQELQAILALTNADQSQLKSLVEAMKPFLGDNIQKAALKALFEEASRVNPSDPPAALKRALEFAKIAGTDIRPDQVSKLAPMVKSGSALDAFAGLYKDATRVSPNDPPAALKEGIDALARSKSASGGPGLNTGEHDWPPIITLSEAGGYFFATGKAELSGDFERALQAKVIPDLLGLAAQYRVDVIEVTGHTDEQPIVPRNSNLDQALLPILKGNGPISTLVPSDNAGLGLSRAVAVARILMADPRVQAYRVLPMSGGQLIDVGERVTEGSKGDLKERRRIEIRLRRSQQAIESRGAISPRAAAH